MELRPDSPICMFIKNGKRIGRGSSGRNKLGPLRADMRLKMLDARK